MISHSKIFLCSGNDVQSCAKIKQLYGPQKSGINFFLQFCPTVVNAVILIVLITRCFFMCTRHVIYPIGYLNDVSYVTVCSKMCNLGEGEGPSEVKKKFKQR